MSALREAFEVLVGHQDCFHAVGCFCCRNVRSWLAVGGVESIGVHCACNEGSTKSEVAPQRPLGWTQPLALPAPPLLVTRTACGAGSFGTVVQASLGTLEVAAKLCRNGDAARECRLLQLCTHSHVVRSFGMHDAEEGPYLCMELLRGGDLGSMLFMHGRLKEANFVVMVRQMCDAICHLHTIGLLHRDIKPDNFGFMFPWTPRSSCDPFLKLLDFGEAIWAPQTRVLKRKCGTRPYMSPEMLGGAYNHRTDMWSLGILCFFALYGYAPFSAMFKVELETEILRAPISC